MIDFLGSLCSGSPGMFIATEERLIFMRKCQYTYDIFPSLLGDCFYGFVKNEVEMDQVLNAYKKETNSLFAIRQTPSPVKEENGTVRLMWKSQHVPYDGTPFINIGKLTHCCVISL